VRTTVAGVLLAAGAGSRLGRPQALVELNGQTLAERGTSMLRAAGADPIILVTGAAPVELDRVHLNRVHIVHNGQWRTGMGSSLRAALRALTGPADGTADGTVDPVLPANVGAVVVALADQPLVGAGAVTRLIAAYRDGASVVVAAYDGRPRNPVLLAREHWPEVIATADGDQGARRSCGPGRIWSRSSSAATPAARMTSTRLRTWRGSPAWSARTLTRRRHHGSFGNSGT